MLRRSEGRPIDYNLVDPDLMPSDSDLRELSEPLTEESLRPFTERQLRNHLQFLDYDLADFALSPREELVEAILSEFETDIAVAPTAPASQEDTMPDGSPIYTREQLTVRSLVSLSAIATERGIPLRRYRSNAAQSTQKRRIISDILADQLDQQILEEGDIYDDDDEDEDGEVAEQSYLESLSLLDLQRIHTSNGATALVFDGTLSEETQRRAYIREILLSGVTL